MTRRAVMVSIAVALSAAVPGRAIACGACIEDRIAATYDHAIVKDAIGRRMQVVFVAIEGPRAAAMGARLAALTAQVPGVRPGSFRTSSFPAAFSFAVGRDRKPRQVVDRFMAALREPGIDMRVIRVMRDGALVDAD